MSSRNRIALSIDVEDWYHTPLVTGSNFSKYKSLDDFLEEQGESYIDCITDETLRLLEILDDFNISATFFMVADVAQRYGKIVSALKGTNHEIASHSLTHQSAIDSKTKLELVPVETWLKEQRDAKKVLEDIFNTEVIGYRAPGAFLASWMIPLLEEIGFKYDSSIAYNSLYNKTNVKLKNIPTSPYYLNSIDLSSENPNSQLMELPWSHLKIPPFITLPAGGAFFFRLLGVGYFSLVLDRALRKGDTMFYIHPLDISSKRIPVSNPRNRPNYWINKGERTEQRLIKLLKKYKNNFTTCKEVYLKNA